jgi:CheY-like chemotaxis protein
MSRVRLLHWKSEQAQAMVELLEGGGFHVEYDAEYSSALMREWRLNPPTAFVIDLTRLPSRGLEIAIALRQSPKTKQVPIVFCEGEAEKLKRIKEALPDAAYCTAKNLLKTLKASRPLQVPAKPAAMMNRFGHRTAAQKLGVIEGTTIAAWNAPRNLNNILGELPPGAEITEQDGAVTLCFVHSVDALRSDISRVRHLAATTKLWILWSKKGSPSHAGVTEPLVRETGIDLGLVDYKICAVDSVWSGMLFAKRK